MKRLLALILVLLMALSVTACGMTAEDIDTAIDILDAVAGALEDTDDTSDDIQDSGAGDHTPPQDDVQQPADSEVSDDSAQPDLDENGTYDSKEDVALYIHLYGRLPKNFITKDEARKLGWEGGDIEKFAPGMSIGGDRFGNFEGLLPEKEGRYYTECDIDTLGEDSRGPKRIVFSNDGLVYYTPDHYETFELLYGEE